MMLLMDRFSEYLRNIISGKLWTYCIAALIIINTIVLGMETYPDFSLPVTFLKDKVFSRLQEI